MWALRYNSLFKNKELCPTFFLLLCFWNSLFILELAKYGAFPVWHVFYIWDVTVLHILCKRRYCYLFWAIYVWIQDWIMSAQYSVRSPTMWPGFWDVDRLPWQGTQLFGEFLRQQMFNTVIKFRSLHADKGNTTRMICDTLCACFCVHCRFSRDQVSLMG